MAKRRFQLPGIQDLSKEQERVRALPFEGQHLIIGGPGTGKSVLALLRAKSLADEDLDYLFLVFNHLLMQSSKKLFGNKLRSQQWQRWFISVFTGDVCHSLPRLPPQNGSRLETFDWEKILNLCDSYQGNDEDGERPFLIIDEGQDMPPGFYEALVKLGFENLFVVADQNQQIADGKNSSRQDLESVLGLDADETIELTENYRNNLAIARLARAFYTGDPASPPPKLPDPPPYEVKKPILFTYSPDQFEHIIYRILTMAINNPRKLIGILCPSNSVREKYYGSLVTKKSACGYRQTMIMTFKYGDKHEMPFDDGGIMVINSQACKGLEFDIVFLSDIDQFTCDAQSLERIKKLFYVMIARATEHVILLRKKGDEKPVDAIIPKDDPPVLEIK
ncbi:ATP-binding domain-containing protein [Halomonas tibetensis]|uniref:DNA 3'-5' helicase II n=1 Tax=Halomonas tibetensis TaxID=2259590 RepID=A0ABV7B833_9GAMM